MITPEMLARHPRIAAVFGALERRYPLYQKTARHIFAHLDEEYLAFAERLLVALDVAPEAGAARLDAFVAYSQEFLVLQARLAREGRYLYRSYAEVSAHVYQNPRMDRYYLDGLLLSQFLWPNHYRMARSLLDLKDRTGPRAAILDVPCGTGLQSLLLASHFHFARLAAVDVSPFSVAYARRLLEAARGPDARVSIAEGDVFQLAEDPRFDLIVCGELLEHLENPGELLTKLGRLLAPGGSIFLTTAIYAAAIDHIYLFSHVREVRDLLSAQFRIESELVLPASLEAYRPEMEPAPINYACVLRAADAR